MGFLVVPTPAYAAKGGCNVMVDKDQMVKAKEQLKQKKLSDIMSSGDTMGLTPEQIEAVKKKEEEKFEAEYVAKEEKFKRELMNPDKNNHRKFKQTNMSRCADKKSGGTPEREQLTYVRDLIKGGYLNSTHLACYCSSEKGKGRAPGTAARVPTKDEVKLRAMAGFSQYTVTPARSPSTYTPYDENEWMNRSFTPTKPASPSRSASPTTPKGHDFTPTR